MENIGTETELWYEKYRPKKFDDYIGNQNKVKIVDDWMKNFYKFLHTFNEQL